MPAPGMLLSCMLDDMLPICAPVVLSVGAFMPEDMDEGIIWPLLLRILVCTVLSAMLLTVLPAGGVGSAMASTGIHRVPASAVTVASCFKLFITILQNLSCDLVRPELTSMLFVLPSMACGTGGPGIFKASAIIRRLKKSGRHYTTVLILICFAKININEAYVM